MSRLDAGLNRSCPAAFEVTRTVTRRLLDGDHFGRAASGWRSTAFASSGTAAESLFTMSVRLAVGWGQSIEWKNRGGGRGQRRPGPPRPGGLGPLGQRGMGYEATELTTALRAALGIDRPWCARPRWRRQPRPRSTQYRGFSRCTGFEIAGLFDADRPKVGHDLDGLPMEPIGLLAARIADLQAELGIITVPADAAQGVADLLAASPASAGIPELRPRSPPHRRHPSRLVTVDLTVQLEQLAFLIQPAANPRSSPC